MITCLKNGGKIISCGNGGSMCDAMHFASELTGKYRKDRPPIAAVAISNPAHMSCVGNDYGYKDVFDRYIRAHAKQGDVLLALSTSGNSENIIYAAGEMHVKQCEVVYITGNNKKSLVHRTALAPYGGDVIIEIPHSGTADRIQEVSIIVLHILVRLIEKGLGYEE
jgi:D-sedoheptulose 7-phosphate isomerase